ncbi:hypothetical protein [Micromonospora aurantiaca (nom. illeg.)]|uniref:hypothetical protein n=1 Tax=Micromonospora aurantiaca (nom. illeg.) TaxID=47850 RepID=UPI0033F7F004
MLNTALIIWAVTSIGVCTAIALVVLLGELADLRREGRAVTQACQAVTTAVADRATDVDLTPAQQAEIARFAAWLDHTPPSAFTWKDLLP